MFFWIREIAGWLLIVLSLWILSFGLQYVENRQIVEGGVVAMIGLGVMRAGVLLVRVSTAARVALTDLKQSGGTA